MIHNKGLVIDKDCGVYDELVPLADMYFYDFNSIEIKSDTIYIIGKRQFVYNIDKIKNIVNTRNDVLIVFSDPYEGSETMEWHIPGMGFDKEVYEKKILVISCGDMDDRFECLRYDSLLPRLYDIESNKTSIQKINEIYEKEDKPYKFLFLNGRARHHRKWLLERFDLTGLLNHSLWTCLQGTGFKDGILRLEYNGKNLMTKDRGFKLLPKEYEVPEVTNSLSKDFQDVEFIKYDLFSGVWQDGIIYPPPYIDTYFSLVTETVIKYPYSMRSEKIWKPIMMGHPWVCASNVGFYRDIRNMGFKTFDKLIDESFDLIENNQDRMERLAQVVEDLCRQDLKKFLAESREICEYNQQLAISLAPALRKDLSKRFIEFVKPYC